MKKTHWWWCATIFTGQLFYAQNAQQDSISIQQLDEVVVSDSRFALKRENSGKTVIKITAEELQKNQGKSVAEIIGRQTGITVNGAQSNAGQNISVFARGGNNRQVLVIIDGIQVNDPSSLSNEFDLRLLNTSQIESIEVLKGAASTLYGNSAATAVINITTKKADKEGFAATLASSLGTNQSQDDQNFDVVDFNNSAQVFYKKGKLELSGSLGNQNTNGLSAAIGEESDEFNRNNANLKLGYSFSDKFNLKGSFYWDELRFGFDNGFPVEDADFTGRSEQLRYALSGAYTYENGSLNINTAFNSINRAFISAFPSDFDSESLVLDVFTKNIFAKRWHTIFGVNVIDQKTDFESDANATTVDPYANVVYTSDFGLNLNLGTRLNNHSEYGSNFIYNINPSFFQRTGDNEYVKFFGSYATSFIAPNLSQLFGAFGPNPDLEPEENRTIEGGFEFGNTKLFRASALYFNRRQENRIDFVTIDPITFAGEFQNTGLVENFHGIELELDVYFTDSLQLKANYAFTDTTEGIALRIPTNTLNAQLNYSLTEKWFMSASYQFVSRRSDTDFSTFTNVSLEPYDLLGFYTKYDINSRWSAFVNVENVFNADYFEVFDFTTRGRNIRVGVNVNL